MTAATNRIQWTTPFEEDQQGRMSVAVCTRELRAAVPVVEAVGFEYLEIHEGAAKARLPLSAAAGNQHGTHQAMIVGLAGDYTGGVAVASLLRGIPILGVHANETGEAMSIWTTKSELSFRQPSTEELFICARVPEEAVEPLRTAYEAGKSYILPVPVEFSNLRGEIVATGQFTYFVRSSTALAPERGRSASIMHMHRVKSSARLLAAARAMETTRPTRLFEDPNAAKVAGEQGRVMAERFTRLLPQLPNMVANRTRSADEALLEALDAGVRQVVIVGVGLDLRPYRLARASVRFFEADLPETLAWRAEECAHLPAAPGARIPIPFNLLHDDLHERLLAAGVDFARPLFAIFEGVSMYFEPEEALRVLEKVSRVVREHRANRLWLDLVSEAVVARRLQAPSVDAFLDGMARLGEPFRFGTDVPAATLDDVGLRVLRDDRADCHRPVPEDPLYAHYRLLRAAPKERPEPMGENLFTDP